MLARLTLLHEAHHHVRLHRLYTTCGKGCLSPVQDSPRCSVLLELHKCGSSSSACWEQGSRDAC